MAKLDSITFSITRTSFPDGHICSVNYSYYLHASKQEYADQCSYTVEVGLFGDDLLHGKPLGDPPYDVHVVDANEPMPVERQFAVNCDLLNETWGEDKIYLKIHVQSSRGERIVQRSATIKDWF